MTADAELPAITCPTSLVASCAPLLGFTPSHCVVAFVSGVPGRPGAVLVRADLPERDHPRAAQRLAASVGGTGGIVVDLVAWVRAADHQPRAELASTLFLDELADRLEATGLQVAACLTTNGRVWWSHACPDDLCCGAPQPLDPDVLTAVRAEYVYAGYAPLSDRAELVQRIASDPARRADVRRLVRVGRPPRDVERWRDRQVAFLSELLVPSTARPPRRPQDPDRGHQPLTTSQIARALRGLADIRVRDTVLHRLIAADPELAHGWARTIDRLCEAVRAAPPGDGAGVATLLALVAWMRGSGALATIALDRADDDQPGYRLAQLTRQVIGRGMDPRMWRASMATLTESECRTGRGVGER